MAAATTPRLPPATGSPSWFEDVFRANYADLVRLAALTLGSTDGAEDVVQAAFIGLHRQPALADPSKVSGYLARSVINGCRTQHRRRVLDRRSARPAANSFPSAETQSVDRMVADQVLGALRILPRRQREAVVCHYSLQLTVAETAELLGISAPSVKTHLQRARSSLAPRLKGLL